MTTYDALRAALSDRYRLERELGAGGMATVHLAHDLRHDRKVAIKVLRPELGALLGAERFLKEIRVTANLQHPAILTLHDSGEAAGLLFYVMPYVEGETLRARLVRESQLPVADAVRIASEIAGALDYAHRHGVLHRDIKPENVLLVEGHALLADFGIALAVREAGGDRLTGTGVSVGTPQYMSPEQAMGDRVLDARTDVYSLAAVTYEMLAGTPPHTGPHAQAIIARLVAEEPRRLTRERPSTPPHVAAAVHRGVAKLAADRFQSAAEFAEALSRPGTGAIASSDAVGVLAGRGSWKSWSRDRRTLAALGVAVAATGLLSASLWRGTTTSATSDAALRFEIGPPESLTDVRADGSRFSLALAPDDRHVAFAAAHGDTSVVFVRALDRFTTYEVRGGEARCPFFSPDGRQLGFIRGDDLWKLNLETGDVARIGPLGEAGWNFAGAAWHPNGDIFAVGSRGVWRVASDGTPPRLVAPNDSASGFGFSWLPTVLPNGRMLVLISRENESRVAILSPEGERLDTLPKQVTGGVWYANGRLIVATSALSIARFDPDRLKPLEAPIELSKRSLDPDTAARFPFLQISARGSAAWYNTGREMRELVWVNRSGSTTPLSLPPAAYRWPQLAPDGHRLAVNPGREQVFVYDLRSGVRTQLGRAGWGGTEPVWAPDGRTVAFALFSSSADRGMEIVLQASDGSAPPEKVVGESRGREVIASDISPDGRWLALYGRTGSDSSDVAIFDRQTGTMRTISLPGYERGARFSRDGKFIVYQSNQTGRSEIYVQPWPALDAKWVISAGGGDEPSWSRDGAELFYRSGDRMMAVRVRTSPTFSASPPVELFHGPFRRDEYGDQSYDVAPDGRFLMMRSVEGSGGVRIRVVKNWLAEALRSQSARD